MKDETKAEILKHALRDLPREACGYLLNVAGKEKYFPCRNIASKTEHFIIHPKDHLAAASAGDIIAVVHSHPYLPPAPSQSDRVACERTKLPWYIISVPNGIFYHDHKTLSGTLEPEGYEAPYIGRTWCHGVLDCYSLCRDWYAREMNLILPDLHREDEWWLKGQNLYVDNFEKHGFERIELKDAQRGDAFLIQHGSDVPNHAAIYLGNERILHHIYTRLSTECPYGGYWKKHTTHVLRYYGNGTGNSKG